MEKMVMINSAFWHGKRVLLSGHTGFKGSWLAIWLSKLGAKVGGIALPPITEPNLFSLAKIDKYLDGYFCDIRNAEKLALLIKLIQPEIVIHLAAQSLVRKSYDDPIETYETNVMGTAHLLNALRLIDCVKVGLIITTDKVYLNDNEQYPFRETDTLGGHDPYSASKASAEIICASFRDAYLKQKSIAIASARAGNVIGGGDWSTDRLIPDAIRAWQSRNVLHIRRPNAVRPWQHVLEPLAAYLKLCEILWDEPNLAAAYNFGPLQENARSVNEVISLARSFYSGIAEVQFEADKNGPHEADWLSLETVKARTVLGIKPQWDIETTVKRTIDWYQRCANGEDARTLCLEDIVAYEATRQS